MKFISKHKKSKKWKVGPEEVVVVALAPLSVVVMVVKLTEPLLSSCLVSAN